LQVNEIRLDTFLIFIKILLSWKKPDFLSAAMNID